MTAAVPQIYAAPSRTSHGDPGARSSLSLSEDLAAPASPSDLLHSYKLNNYVWRVVIVAGLGNLLFGVDTGVISSVLARIGSDLGGQPLSAGTQEAIVSATTLGALASSCIAGATADRFGRKPVIIAAAVLFVLGSLEQAASQVTKEMIVGRVIVGMAVGLASMVLPTYIAEVAPAPVRGKLVTTLIVLITGGQVLAYFIGFAFYNLSHGWRYMLGASSVPAIIQLLLSFSLPESPRYLIRCGRINDARFVLGRIFPGSSAAGIERAIEEVQEALDAEDEASMPLKLHYGFFESWRDRLWSDIATRRALIVACGLQFFQQATGFNSLMYFSVTILQRSGFDQPAGPAIFVAVANFLSTLVALRIIDKTGRRKVLLVGTAAMSTALAFVAFFFIFVNFSDGPDVDHSANVWSYLALVAMVVFTCCYAMSLGNIPWLIQAEIFTFGVRAVAGAFATATCWLSNLLISATFLHLVSSISPTGTFGLYCVSAATACLFTWALVPETSGLTIEECRSLFEGPTPFVFAGARGDNKHMRIVQEEDDEERQALFEQEPEQGQNQPRT